jgi:predicted PhzF superfamily epimerase YddE/YHI9
VEPYLLGGRVQDAARLLRQTLDALADDLVRGMTDSAVTLRDVQRQAAAPHTAVAADAWPSRAAGRKPADSQVQRPHRQAQSHSAIEPYNRNQGAIRMTTLLVLRVFTDEDGQYGNALGVVLDGPAIPEDRRQSLAAELGFSETVYVDDAATGRVRIFTPASELPLAGHPLVSTSWLLEQQGQGVTELNPPAGPVATWNEDSLTWIRGPVSAAPPWTLNAVEDAATVDAMTGPPTPEADADQYWAYEDEQAGVVRARVFAARYDVHEDEACGSASMLLADRLQRPITTKHGHGSVMWARPAADGMAEVGGRVVLDEQREVA